MPIWFELLVLLLVAYTAGLGIGWLLWGRAPTPDTPQDEGETLP